MKRILLILLLSLCGLTPAQKRVVLNQFSESQCDNLIQSAGPTMSLDIPSAEIERAPIVHFLLEDNAASTAVVNKANAALAGTASANTNTFCNTAAKIGKGCTFAIASSHAIDGGSDFLGTGADSFCAWVSPTDATAGAAQRFFDNGKFLFGISSSGILQVSSDGGGTIFQPGNAQSDGVFIHACVVRASTGLATIYVNGAVYGDPAQATGTPEAGTGNVIIGNRATADRDFGGILDDIRIYDYALTPAQISAIYNNGTGHQKLATREKANVVTVVGATTAVSSILDRQGIEFNQSTAANQPALLTSAEGMNGRRAVRFDGVADGMTSTTTNAGIFAAGAKTLFITGRAATVATAASQGLLANATSNAIYAFIETTGEPRFYNTDAGGADNAIGPAALVANRPFIYQGLHSSGNVFAGADGRLGAAVASDDTATMTNELSLGYRASDGARFYNGDLQTLLTFAKVLPSDTRAKINRCLCRKAGASC